MLHTVLRRRANGESVEQIRPDLIIPTGKRKGQHPSRASIYRALAEHDKAQAYPEAIDQAHADFARPPGEYLTARSSLVSQIRPEISAVARRPQYFALARGDFQVRPRRTSWFGY